MKGYKDRKRFVEPQHEHLYYSGSSIAPSIILNGRLVGTWNYGLTKKEKVTFNLVADLDQKALELAKRKIRLVREFLDTLRKGS